MICNICRNTEGSHLNGSNNDVVDVVHEGDEILQFPVNNENANAKCNKCSLPLELENKISPQIKANPNSESSDQKPKPRKAEHFPMSFIQIGDYKVRGRHEAHLVGKCFYGKKKLAWEILNGALKNKMEISWPYICGMRVTMPQNCPGILQFELSQPPKFFGEDDPRPRKHTIWKPSSDFTRGQATKNRIHVVHFPVGVLNKYCDKLTRSSDQFMKMMQRPFPTSQSPFFDFYSYKATPRFSYGDGVVPTCPSTHLSFPSNTPILPLPNSPSPQSHQFHENSDSLFGLARRWVNEDCEHGCHMTSNQTVYGHPASWRSIENLRAFDNAIPTSSDGSDYTPVVHPTASFSPQQFEQFQTASIMYQGANGSVSSAPVMGFCSSLNEGINNSVLSPPIQQQLGHNGLGVIPYPLNQGLNNHMLHQEDNVVTMHQGINNINPISPVSDEVIDKQRLQPSQLRFRIPARLGIEDDQNSLPSGILRSGSEALNNHVENEDPAKTIENGGGINEACGAMKGDREDITNVWSSNDIFEGLTLEESNTAHKIMTPSLFELWDIDKFDGLNLDQFVMED